MNKARIEVRTTSLPDMRRAAQFFAERALGGGDGGVTYWLKPLESAYSVGQTLMGASTEWCQEWEVRWAETEDDLLED